MTSARICSCHIASDHAIERQGFAVRMTHRGPFSLSRGGGASGCGEETGDPNCNGRAAIDRRVRCDRRVDGAMECDRDLAIGKPWTQLSRKTSAKIILCMLSERDRPCVYKIQKKATICRVMVRDVMVHHRAKHKMNRDGSTLHSLSARIAALTGIQDPEPQSARQSSTVYCQLSTPIAVDRRRSQYLSEAHLMKQVRSPVSTPQPLAPLPHGGENGPNKSFIRTAKCCILLAAHSRSRCEMARPDAVRGRSFTAYQDINSCTGQQAQHQCLSRVFQLGCHTFITNGSAGEANTDPPQDETASP